jgi:signal transduction histidine kinase
MPVSPSSFAPRGSAFGVVDGATHVLRYANMAFTELQSAGVVAITGHPADGTRRGTDLTPWLDLAASSGATIRRDFVSDNRADAERLVCTVTPLSGHPSEVDGLFIEVRGAAIADASLVRQRAVTERFLLAAMREQDSTRNQQEVARAALATAQRADFLAAASHDLAMTLDEGATRDTVTRSVLPRAGTWCIVDVVESNGSLHRLAVVHPDAAKQTLARALVEHWVPRPTDSIGAPSVLWPQDGKYVVVCHPSAAPLIAAAHGEENLAILERLGFGALLVVPLVVHGALLGAITFVTAADDTPFAADEISLACDLADRCAMALESARLYRESDEMRAAADLASRAKSTFLGNMSHELMTPLNAIGGYAELLDLGLRGPVTPEQRVDLARITQNQRHLLTLISEILTFVRSDSGRMEFHPTGIPLGEALKDVADMLGGAARRKKITLEQSADDTGAVAWADPDRLRQIIMNLVMNAVKYSSEGGGNITLSSGVSPDSVCVQISDHGPGIPSEKLSAIFEPFVQLDGGLTKRQGGVGLGLAISRDLARAMGGDITVESTVGTGSTFTVTLPPHHA